MPRRGVDKAAASSHTWAVLRSGLFGASWPSCVGPLRTFTRLNRKGGAYMTLIISLRPAASCPSVVFCHVGVILCGCYLCCLLPACASCILSSGCYLLCLLPRAHAYRTPRAWHHRRRARPTRSFGSSCCLCPWRSKNGKPLHQERPSAWSHAASRSAWSFCHACHGRHLSRRPCSHQAFCVASFLSKLFAWLRAFLASDS